MTTKTVTININGVDFGALVTFKYTPPVNIAGQPLEPEHFDITALEISGNDCSGLIAVIENDLIDELEQMG